MSDTPHRDVTMAGPSTVSGIPHQVDHADSTKAPNPTTAQMPLEEHVPQHASQHPVAPLNTPSAPIFVDHAPLAQWTPETSANWPQIPVNFDFNAARDKARAQVRAGAAESRHAGAAGLCRAGAVEAHSAGDASVDPDNRPQKRLRNDEFKSSNRTVPFLHGSLAATHQLAQPRPPPGSSPPSQGSEGSGIQEARSRNVDMEADGFEDTGNGLGREGEEIMKSLYEGDLGSENGSAMRRVVRLMNRFITKQDAILQRMDQQRPPTGNSGTEQNDSSCPGTNTTPKSSDDCPPRTSPHQPPKKKDWDQTVPCTTPAGRQPRVERRILISKTIRTTIAELLKLPPGKPKPPFINPPETTHIPTLNNFAIQWLEKEKSLFNSLATNIAVEQVTEKWPYDPLTECEQEQLFGMVQDHIRYLSRIHNKACLPDAAQSKQVALRNASASSRRATLYESRLRVIDRFPVALRAHRNLIVQLGLAGTSSDEEDPIRPKVYMIKRRPELSTKVQVLKSKLDLVYNLYFKGPGSKGSQMHMRVLSDKVSTRPLDVVGLPITCLSRAWLRSLTEPEREFYQFEPHIYDYSFPDGLLRRDVGRTPNQIVLSEEEDGADDEL